MIKWTNVVKEVGLNKLEDFCNGSLTYKEFESCGPESRRVIRNNGVRRTRRLASQAVRRRKP